MSGYRYKLTDENGDRLEITEAPVVLDTAAVCVIAGDDTFGVYVTRARAVEVAEAILKAAGVRERVEFDLRPKAPTEPGLYTRYPEAPSEHAVYCLTEAGEWHVSVPGSDHAQTVALLEAPAGLRCNPPLVSLVPASA